MLVRYAAGTHTPETVQRFFRLGSSGEDHYIITRLWALLTKHLTKIQPISSSDPAPGAGVRFVTSEIGKALRLRLLESLQRRFDVYLTDNSILLATALDPRNRGFWFLPDKGERVLSALKWEFDHAIHMRGVDEKWRGEGGSSAAAAAAVPMAAEPAPAAPHRPLNNDLWLDEDVPTYEPPPASVVVKPSEYELYIKPTDVAPFISAKMDAENVQTIPIPNAKRQPTEQPTRQNRTHHHPLLRTSGMWWHRITVCHPYCAGGSSTALRFRFFRVSRGSIYVYPRLRPSPKGSGVLQVYCALQRATD